MSKKFEFKPEHFRNMIGQEFLLRVYTEQLFRNTELKNLRSEILNYDVDYDFYEKAKNVKGDLWIVGSRLIKNRRKYFALYYGGIKDIRYEDGNEFIDDKNKFPEAHTCKEIFGSYAFGLEDVKIEDDSIKLIGSLAFNDLIYQKKGEHLDKKIVLTVSGKPVREEKYFLAYHDAPELTHGIEI
jgi:hypothetical protein